MAGMPQFAELHLHLEGAIEPETLREIDPSLTMEEIAEATAFTDFAGFLQSYKWVNQRLRGPADYGIAARRLFERLNSQGVSYAEITLSAGVILWKQQEFGPIWDSLARESGRAKVKVRWILDAVRHFGPEPAREVFELAAERVNDGVAAIGIGGDEARGPARWFGDLYKRARDRGLRLTAHAGETTGAADIREAIEIGAERIGHGIRAIQDPGVMEILRARNIPLEICITSNLRTGVIARLPDHPIRKLHDAGIPIVLNSDDPSLFGTTLTREYEIARNDFGFTDAEISALHENSLRYAFAAT